MLKGVAVPPSLKNMYKELQTDIAGFRVPRHGMLQSWASEGVLLLNTTLTVCVREKRERKEKEEKVGLYYRK